MCDALLQRLTGLGPTVFTAWALATMSIQLQCCSSALAMTTPARLRYLDISFMHDCDLIAYLLTDRRHRLHLPGLRFSFSQHESACIHKADTTRRCELEGPGAGAACGYIGRDGIRFFRCCQSRRCRFAFNFYLFVQQTHTYFSRDVACILLMINPVCKPGQEGQSRIAEALDWLERHSEDPCVSKPPPTPQTKEAPEIVTINLPLSLPITPAISLSPSREDKRGDEFVHFQVDFNFNGPFEYAPSAFQSWCI